MTFRPDFKTQKPANLQFAVWIDGEGLQVKDWYQFDKLVESMAEGFPVYDDSQIEIVEFRANDSGMDAVITWTHDKLEDEIKQKAAELKKERAEECAHRESLMAASNYI